MLTMATAMCRLRMCLGKFINASFEKSLFSKTCSRTYIAASYASVTTSNLKYTCFDLAPKIQALVLCNKVPATRYFSTDKKLSTEEVAEKVLHVCKTFDKIPSDKLTLDSHFMNDLGLDSLDHVELIMNIEDDFNFEIPDADAEKLLRPKDIVAYIEQKEASSKQ